MRTGWLVMMIVGCGDDGAAPIDAPVPKDAAIDAPACGFTVAPTLPARMVGSCNELTGGGCEANEKCTWVQYGAEGALGCAPVGHAQDNCACTVGVIGATGYDDCAAGLICLEGQCAPICNRADVVSECDANEACTEHATFFFHGTPLPTHTASVCTRTCDPLTQTRDDTLAPACGSPDPSAPTRGCYGYDTFTCMDAGPLTATDRQTPASLQNNGCAPGFQPLVFETTGSNVILCAGYCSPLEIDNTSAHSMNHKGNPSALAKLPTQAQARAGDATCDIGKKGSHASSTCVYRWSTIGDLANTAPSQFNTSRYVDTLGFCIATAFMSYDPAGGGNFTTPWPDCATLAPRSSATPGPRDDAADFLCQKFSSSQFTSARVPDLRLGHRNPVPVLRHRFD